MTSFTLLLGCAYDFAVNIVMLDLNIYDTVKKIIYAASTYDFAVNNVMVIIITISKTLGIYDLLKNYFMLLRKYECFQCFNIYTSTPR